jgi:hypothetical protein
MAEDINPAIRGEVTLLITEKEDGNWYSELKPKILCTEPRDMYKLALICASVQDHVSKNLAFIDTLIKTNEEVRKIHNELVEERGGKNQTHKAWQQAEDATPDTEKYQTKLPFEEDTDAT